MSRGERSRNSDSTVRQDHLIDQLPGLRPDDLQALREQGISTIAQLWDRTRTPAHQRHLAQHLHCSLRDVQKWSAMADLARIPGIGCRYCGVLLHVGVRSSQQLARSSAPKLHQQILRLQVLLIQQREHCPEPGQIARWIQQAASLQRRK